MYIVYGSVQLFLHYSFSLKDKRQIIQSIIGRSRKRFNISICEVDHHELWQRSALGWSAACSAYSDAVRIIDAIRETLEKYEDQCEITDFEAEIIKH
jgi:uncharacterized protein